jgi:glycosyltransferase involved in cell wall biosynthesis
MTNKYSIIIPACNEALFIGKAIDSIKKAIEKVNSSYEIIVVLNRCTDNTEAIALANNALIVHCDEKNLSMIRNAGANAATGEIIITIDADSRMAENMFIEIEKALSNSTILGGGTIIVPERISLGILMTGIFLLPAVVIDRISAGLFFVRRSSFDAIGGFDESLLSAEDIDFARRLKKYGKTKNQRFVTLWKTRIITSCRKFDRFGDWFFVKNPLMVYRLLKGKDRRFSDLVWYDFHRKNQKNHTNDI